MPYQQVFELKDRGQTHGSTIVDQSINLSVKGMPRTISPELFPEVLALTATTLELAILELETGSAGNPSLTFNNDPNTGIYRTGVDQLAFSTGGALRMQISSIGTLRISDGDAGQPGLGFLNDLNTGIYRSAADFLNFATGGTNRFFIDSSGNFRSSGGKIQPDSGSAAAPGLAFEGDADTGIYRPGVDQLAFSTNGVERMQISSIGTLRISDGSATQPGLGFLNDLDTGIYRSGADFLNFATGGTNRFFIDSSGNFRSNGGKIQPDGGSAAAPGLAFEGDADTGIYRPGVDQLSLVTGGGSGQATLAANGRLTLQGSGSELRILSRDNDDQPVIWYNDTGNRMICFISGDRLVITTSTMTFNGSTVLHTGNHGGSATGHVTNGDSHNHSGGDGGNLNHGQLAGLGDINDHTWAIIDGGTTTAAANTWFGGARSIKVVSSQLKNKTSISPLLTTDEHPPMVPAEKQSFRRYPYSVLDLTPIQFKSVLDGDDGRLVRTGFLWEDVDENYPAGTQDESLDVNALIAGLVAEVKQLRQEVNELKGNHGDS